MKKNDTFTITIEDMSVRGEGIGHREGMTFFIKDALVGDMILAAVTKIKKDLGYARLVEVLQPSPFRVEAKCPVARTCGGCQMQTLSYEKQLELKERILRNNMQRIGGFSPEFLSRVTRPMVGMETPFRYRNKAQFPVAADKDGRIVTGFYAARSHQVIPITDCMLGVEENAEILACIRQYMEHCHVAPYEEATGKGLIRHVLLRKGFTSGEFMVCLIVNGRSLPEEAALVQELCRIPGMTSITLNVNTRRDNRILGEELRVLWGQAYICDTIHRVKEEADGFHPTGESVHFAISPKSFYQVNPRQTEKLYSLALELAELTGKETVWDLYCGIGTISLFLAKEAAQVYGVEILPEAIDDARENAVRNGIRNAEFFVGKAEEILPAWAGEKQKRPDVIVVDPPRKGCDERCLEVMVKMAPKRILYISCDPATLSRDLKYLAANNYILSYLRPVDQFCHSMHIEAVALLVRERSDRRSN
jgi:23S rRNA (uracil1939-C5)-methyltransferase